MKRIMSLFLLLLLLLFLGCASAVPLVEKSSIIILPGMSKQQIYQKSLQWLTYKFISGRAVIDYKDIDTGRIIAKGSFLLGIIKVMGAQYRYVNMIGTIDCINGKAKITILPQGCQFDNGRGLADCPCSWDYLAELENNIQPATEKFIQDYREYMTGGQAPAWDGK